MARAAADQSLRSPALGTLPAESRRILIVCNVDWFFVSHRLPLAVAARARGYDVHVACAAQSEVARARITAAGVTFHPLPLSRAGRNPAAELRTLVALAQLYRRLAPDLVHHVTIKPVIYGSIAAALFGPRVVVNALSGLGFVFTHERRGDWIRALVLAAYRALFRRPGTFVIFQNPDDLAWLVDDGVVPRESAVLIRGSGVNLEQFAFGELPDGEPIVLLPARMLADKGVAEFVEAARMVRATGRSARFVLAGGLDDSNPAGISKSTIESWVAEGAIEWWGHRTDMPSVLQQARIVCLPSYREGLPKALLEAMAVGRPVITCDVPGCRELVDGNGRLVRARDARDLAEAIAGLLDDDAGCREMGRRSRRLAELHFGEGAVVDRTLALYTQALLGPDAGVTQATGRGVHAE